MGGALRMRVEDGNAAEAKEWDYKGVMCNSAGARDGVDCCHSKRKATELRLGFRLAGRSLLGSSGSLAIHPCAGNLQNMNFATSAVKSNQHNPVCMTNYIDSKENGCSLISLYHIRYLDPYFHVVIPFSKQVDNLDFGGIGRPVFVEMHAGNLR